MGTVVDIHQLIKDLIDEAKNQKNLELVDKLIDIKLALVELEDENRDLKKKIEYLEQCNITEDDLELQPKGYYKGVTEKMIYKKISFRAAPFTYELFFDDRITLVGGDNGTGKTVLYEILEDLKLTNEYNAIKLFNYKSDNMKENLMKCKECFVVIDNADILIDDDIRQFINFECSNQYMLFLRNCDGLNVSDKSFKIMHLEGKKITLQDEL